MAFSRAFLAVDPDAAGRERLAALQDALRQAMEPGLRGWTQVDDLHLTLRFFGQLNAAEADHLAGAVESITAGARGFNLEFQRLAAWPTHRPSLCVALFESSPVLDHWVAAISDWAQAQGLAAESQPFRAHVTLFRRRQPLPPLPQIKLAAFELPVTQLALMHRAAPGVSPRYCRQACWSLSD